jgi:hypothetical protein
MLFGLNCTRVTTRQDLRLIPLYTVIICGLSSAVVELTMIQVVKFQPLTAEVLVLFQASPCKFYGL